jgi:hypothetical protein
MDTLRTKIFSKQFVKNYIIFSSSVTGSLGASYALIYGSHNDTLPKLIDNENNNLGITILNLSICVGRIPMYLACGMIIGGTGSIILPIALPIWSINKLWQMSPDHMKNELKE